MPTTLQSRCISIRKIRQLALASLLLVAGLFGLITQANAGEYTVNYCRDAADNPIKLEDWTVETRVNDSDDLAQADNTVDNCLGAAATSPAAQINWQVWRGIGSAPANSPRPAGKLHGLRLTPPTTIALRGVRITGSVDVDSLTPNGSVQWNGFGCYSHNAACADRKKFYSSESFSASGEGYFSILCPTTSTAGCSGQASALLEKAEATYSEAIQPTAVPTAALYQSSGYNPVSGLQTVLVDASDLGSGVKKLWIEIDGVKVNETVDFCSTPYKSMRPCPSQVSQTKLPFGTSHLADGPHQINIFASDAAGNSSLAHSGSFVSQNNPDVGPGDHSVTRGCEKPNGINATDNVSWSGGWAKNNWHSLRSKYSDTKSDLLSGRLKTQGGQPIVNAQIDIIRTKSITSQQPVVVSTVKTDQAGGFEYRSARKGGSAGYIARYQVCPRDTVFQSTGYIHRVIANSTFKASNLNPTVGRRMYFSGKLSGAENGDAKTTTVYVQKRSAGRWRTIALTDAVKADGNWKVRYTFSKASQVASYRARIHTDNADFPFDSGYSSRIKLAAGGASVRAASSSDEDPDFYSEPANGVNLK